MSIFVKSVALAVACSVSFVAVPKEVHMRYTKELDHDLRRANYKACKQDKRKNCHYEAFEKSFVWKATVVEV